MKFLEGRGGFHRPLKAFPLGGRWPRRGRMRGGKFRIPCRARRPRRAISAVFRGGFRRLRAATYFAHGGKVGKTPPGTAPNEHFVLIVAFPRTPLWGTRTCQVLQCFRRAKFEWLSAVQSGPLGPGYTKILTTALSELRLALPSQRSWCVSWREPQGAPLREIGSVSILL